MKPRRIEIATADASSKVPPKRIEADKQAA
jgi:hypothetical protein